MDKNITYQPINIIGCTEPIEINKYLTKVLKYGAEKITSISIKNCKVDMKTLELLSKFANLDLSKLNILPKIYLENIKDRYKLLDKLIEDGDEFDKGDGAWQDDFSEVDPSPLEWTSYASIIITAEDLYDIKSNGTGYGNQIWLILNNITKNNNRSSRRMV